MAFFHVYRNDYTMVRTEEDKSPPREEEPNKPKILDNTKIRSIKPERKEGVFVFFGLIFIGSVVGFIAYEQFTNDSEVLFLSSSKKSGEKHKINEIDNQVFSDVSLEYKVTNFLIPQSYSLYIAPNMSSNNFSGRVTIRMKCIQKTFVIGLHSSQHHVRSIEINSVHAKYTKNIHVVSYARKNNVLAIILKEMLIPGHRYDVSIGFLGNVTEESQGMFLRTYQDGDGIKRNMIASIFQYGKARNIFPCFDDTAYNTSFQITLQHKKTFTAISNMPVERTVMLPDGLVETYFKTSPPISTDHVSFVIAEYSFREIVTSYGYKVRLYAPKGRLSDTEGAGKLVASLIQYFQVMFGLGCSFPKLDFVPMVMFSSHISFSPGLSILPEEVFLLNVHTKTLSLVEKSALAFGKAVAKQLFGCLMHMDLRSNARFIESLVLYLGYQAASYHYPLWSFESQFYIDVTNLALIKDESEKMSLVSNGMHYYDLNTRALEGAAILKMMSRYIGVSSFHESIMLSFNNMLKQSDTFTGNLMDVLMKKVSQARNVDILKSWFAHPGLRLVTMSSGKIAGQYIFRQKDFIQKNSNITSTPSFNWPIPILVKSVCDSTTRRFVLRTKAGKVQLSECDLQKVNSGGYGFYRVNYSNSDWRKFNELLNKDHRILSSADRANLISDIFVIARFNPQYITTALSFTTYLNKELHYAPFKVALVQLNKMVDLFAGTQIETSLQKYIEIKTQPVLHYLNTDKKHGHMQRKLIGLLMREAVMYHKTIAVCIDNMFLRWVISNSMKQPPKHLRELAFEVGIMRGSSIEWNYLFEYFKKVPSIAEKDLALSGLSVTQNKHLLERLMEYANKCDISSVTCTQQKFKIWTKVCKNRNGGNELAKNAFFGSWRYVLRNVEQLYDTIEAFMLGCLGSGKSVADIKQLETIDVTSLSPTSKVLLEKVHEHINRNIILRKSEEDVGRWLKFRSS